MRKRIGFSFKNDYIHLSIPGIESLGQDFSRSAAPSGSKKKTGRLFQLKGLKVLISEIELALRSRGLMYNEDSWTSAEQEEGRGFRFARPSRGIDEGGLFVFVLIKVLSLLTATLKKG